MKKRLIVVIPHHFEFFKCFESNLQQAGYEVSFVFTTDSSFRYKTVSEKICSFIQKNVFNNKSYKANLKITQNSRNLIEKLHELKVPVDYSLVIRADFLNTAAISCLKEKSKKIFAYQWDGYNRSATGKDLIHLFDSFFVFDPDDCKKYGNYFLNLKCVTNFYLDMGPNENVSDGTVFFIGRYLKERTEQVLKITEILAKKGVKANVNIVTHSKSAKKKIKSDNIKILKDPLSYGPMLKMLQAASYILDFENAEQKGLTFRVFESLFFQKKLITNNQLVCKYDFYHPNNIFIWNDSNIDGLEEFLKLPYKEIAKDIVHKYSATNWIKNVLDEQPYHAINVPE